MIIILISKQMGSEPFFSKDDDDFSSQSIGPWDKRVGKQHIWQFIFPGDFTLVLTLHLSDSDLFQQGRCCFSYSYVIFYVFREENNMIWHFVEKHAGHVPESRQFLLHLVPSLHIAPELEGAYFNTYFYQYFPPRFTRVYLTNTIAYTESV